ncbi:hypothetical protein HDV05_003281, partial [Chytridiales sp. JEL 0842]
NETIVNSADPPWHTELSPSAATCLRSLDMLRVDSQQTLHMEKTDPNKWRLEVGDGRQIWHYIEDETKLKERPQ